MKTFQDFEVLDFKYRVKSKTRKLRKWAFFLLKKVIFQSVFRFWVSYNTENLSKRKLSVISEFSILGYRAKSKTWKSWKFLFFLLNHIGTFQFFVQFIKKLLRTLKLSDIISVFEKLNHSNEANYRTLSILPLVLKKFEKIMYNRPYEYIANFLSLLLCGFRTAISPISTFTKTWKELDSGGLLVQF